jgi:hypothetical protein
MTDKSWIQTRSGKKFYPLDPEPALIDINDIAHSLAMQCRFGGHSNEFYSVAQHSVMLSRTFFRGTGARMRLLALLHDASEAYLSDVPRPLKQLPEFEFYREAERRLQDAINACFGLPGCGSAEFAEVLRADTEMLGHEARNIDVMLPVHPDWSPPELTRPKIWIVAWNPQTARERFLEEFNSLTAMYEKDNLQGRKAETEAAPAGI